MIISCAYNPSLRALSRTFFFPIFVFGPVDFCAFFRFVLIFAGLVGGRTFPPLLVGSGSLLTGLISPPVEFVKSPAVCRSCASQPAFETQMRDDPQALDTTSFP